LRKDYSSSSPDSDGEVIVCLCLLFWWVLANSIRTWNVSFILIAFLQSRVCWELPGRTVPEQGGWVMTMSTTKY
jgi:hypothetical protein